ncbi:FAD binding domain-containing protein [Bradyrhizobium mercantei]|uniref:FAD binding domain-containing protein n=1 Tax=Bradyrhizobium mercantei TaxID=1904807 RepID=UPI000975CE22|nr:FAD binding domain-containing protein [Bradyrhizobium mercantei]
MTLSDPKHKRVTIIGGSIGGLFAGLFLRKAGWQVDIYERVPDEIKSRGAGIVTHAPLFDALRRIDAMPDGDVGVAVEGRRVFASDGVVTGSLPFPQVLTSWDRLYRLLYDRFPRERYHQGRSLISIAQQDDEVVATFDDGRVIRSDLLIGADGHRSTVRMQYAPEVQPEYAGYVAWRGLVQESALSPDTREALFRHFSFSLPEREQMLGYPVAGANEDMRLGHRRYNFVWYRPADERTELRRLLTDKNGNSNGMSVAPTAIHPDVLGELRSEANRRLSPQFTEIVHRTELPMIQPIYDVTSKQVVFDRVILLGDAAFVARPHCGMGVTKAAQDASALFDALTEQPDIDRALARYQAERVPFGTRVVQHAQALGRYMQAQIASAEERRAAEIYRTPEAVMKETAASAFLEDYATSVAH